MRGSGHVHPPGLARKVVPADVAAAMIGPGATVGMSGLTGAGYPKEVPLALAQRISEANASGARFKINV
jgi:succinyl-CoA:acetate CoA-transferase